MKKCFIYQKLLPLYVYNELTELEQAELAAHLQVCPACHAALKEVQETLNFIPRETPVPPEVLPAFRKVLSLKLHSRHAPANNRFAIFSFIHARPVFQAGFAALLILLGFLLNQQLAPKSENGYVLQQILASSQSIRFSNGELNPFLGQIERIKVNPETGQIEIEYQTIHDVAFRGNLQNETIQGLLQQALQEENNQAVRLHAVKALAGTPQNINSKTLNALIALLKKEENSGVRLQILQLLKSLPLNEQIKSVFVQILLYDKNEALRIEAFKTLTAGNLPQQEQESLLRKARLDSNSFIQYQAEEKLQQFQEKSNDETKYL